MHDAIRARGPFLFAGLLATVIAFGVGCGKTPGTGDDDDDDATSSPSETVTTPPPGSITYYEDLLPIIQTHCSDCHTDGGVGPGHWDEYPVASAYSALLTAYTADRTMPPWPPEPSCGREFHGERLMTQNEVLTFQWWHDDGTPEGDPANAPTPPPAPDPNHGLGAPDIEINTGTHTPDFSSGGDDIYWCFRLDPGLAGDRDFTAVEILPGNLAIDHHALLFREPDGASQPTGLPGFECPGVPTGDGQNINDMVAGWTPGARPFIFPENMGMQLKAGDALLLQVHYHRPDGTGVSPDDNSQVRIWLSPSPVQERANIVWLGNPLISIPSDGQEHSVTGNCTIPQSAGAVKVLAVGPHMHELGVKFNATATINGNDSCMVDIGRWDFEWQGTYQYTAMPTLNPGDKIQTKCTWVNNTGSTVQFGEGTNDEMCFLFLTVAAEGNFGPTCFF